MTLGLLLGGFVLPSSAQASGKSRTPKKTAPADKQVAQATDVVVTGSLLPQKIKADQRIPPTSFNLTIIDQKMIQTSGAADLARVLRRSAAGVR